MSIDWINFTPWRSLCGGALIGLAVSVFVLVNGRIAGISGLLGGVMQFGGDGWSEKAFFLLGLVISPLLWGASTVLPKIEINTEWPSGSARGRGNPLRFGLYERPWSVWGFPIIFSLHRGDGLLYDYWICNGVRQSPCVGIL